MKVVDQEGQCGWAWIIGNRYEFQQQNGDGSPNADGVYGLVRGGTKIYVGGGNIRNRLQSQYRGDNPCIKLEKPSHCYREARSDWKNREKELAYDPICNKQIG